MKEELKRYIPVLVIGVIAIRFFAPGLFEAEPIQKTAKAEPVEEPDVVRVNPFLSVELEAESAHVMDLTSGEVLYEKDSTVQLPLASLTKLMTVFVALESINPIESVAIGNDAINQGGANGLILGERWKVEDLADFALVSSSNDAAYALASAAASSLGSEDIVSQMNIKADEIGLEQTYFLNPTGLDVSEESLAGAYGSAQDVSKMLAHILRERPGALEATQEDSVLLTSLDSRRHETTNTNQSLKDMPWLIASKTGFTELAGGNLAVAFDAGLAKPVVITVMGSTIDGRFTDVQRLIEKTFEYLETK